RDSVLTLTFNRSIDIPTGETAGAYLAKYLALMYDDENGQAQPEAFTASLDPEQHHKVHVTPESLLEAGVRYRLLLKAEPADGGRRTTGLFDYELRFQTGSGFGGRLEIVGFETPV